MFERCLKLHSTIIYSSRIHYMCACVRMCVCVCVRVCVCVCVCVVCACVNKKGSERMVACGEGP